MAKTKLFETAHANGVAQFLVTGTGNNTIVLTDDLTGAVDLDAATEGVQGQTISITKLHWSGGTTITDSAALTFTLDGNGAWSQFNGWTPVDVTGDLIITATGTLFIEVKKGKGYN